jgi:two-component sensor histidine kinase
MTEPQKKPIADIGGKRAISLVPYIIIAPTTILSVVLIEPTEFTLNQVSGWLIASAVGYLLFCALLFMAHLTIFRNRAITPLPVWSVFALGFFAGAIKGATTGYISFQLGLVDSLQFAVVSRIYSAGFLGLIGVPSIAIIMASVDRFRVVRKELISEQMQIQTQKLFNQNMIPAMQDELRKVVNTDLNALTKELQGSLLADAQESASWRSLAENLRNSASFSIREMSHKLWDQKPSKFPDLTFTQVARYMLSKNPFPLGIIMPVFVISAIPVGLKEYNAFESFLRISITSVAMLAVLVIARSVIDSSRRFKEVVYVFGVVFTATMPNAVSLFYFNDPVDAGFYGFLATQLIYIPTVVIFSGLIVAALRMRQDVLDQIQANIDATRIEAMATEHAMLRLSKEMAKYLHGNLQSRMMASALAIESAGKADNQVNLEYEISQVRNTFTTPFDHFNSLQIDSLSNSLAGLKRIWDGLVEIDATIDGNEADHSSLDNTAIFQCLEEGVANAVRHGLASEVVIEIKMLTNQVDIKITDNGLGPREGDPGLGSSLFTSFAGNRWSLNRGPQGVGAQVNLSIARLEPAN